MTYPDPQLAEPLTLSCGTVLKNRLVMAPMTTCAGFYNGSVTSELVEYYRQRAGEAAVIIVECCYVEDNGPAFPGALGIDSDMKITGLEKIASAIKQRGSKAVLQIYHGGRMSEPLLIGGRQPVAPSAVAIPREGAATPRALSAEEVSGMVEKFGQAVRRAIAAGFDGVEIHGANTYLIQQFFSPHANRRDDQWGGNSEKRARFPLAVLDITRQMARQYAEPGFIIGYRFSPEETEQPGIRFADTLYLLDKLATAGLDYVHFSMNHILRSSLVDTADRQPLIDKYMAGRSAALATVPVIGVGSVTGPEDVTQAFSHGYSLVAVGRAAIASPAWSQRLLAGESLTLTIDNRQREALCIPEPLWYFPQVAAMVRDMSLATGKFAAGSFRETLQDDQGDSQLTVVLSEDRITDLMLDAAPAEDVEFTTHFKQLRSRILDANSPYVDAVTGATTRSEEIKKAVARVMMTSARQRLQQENGGQPASYDVVVIGSGGAGLTAAIQASELGAKVLIVEKMPIPGGNTLKASVGMNAAETRFQTLKGISDSKELFYQETLAGGQGKNNTVLLHEFVEQAPQAIDWLAERGIVLSDITITGGMSIDRTHRPADASAVGGYLVSGLLKNIQQRPDIEIMTDTSVTGICCQDGQVCGVTLMNTQQESQDISCRSLVVATGGFSANPQMVVHYRPDLAGFVTTNHPGATGSGIALLQTLGAGTVDMGEIQIHPTVEQTTSYLISEAIRGGGAILVSQQGQRFINEMDTRDKVSARIIGLPEKAAWIIFDQQIREHNKATETYIARGFVISAETPAALAAALAMDTAALQTTLDQYNRVVTHQQADIFGRTTALRQPLDHGPYYAIRIAPGVHHTMGGVTINTRAEVLGQNRQPLAGVFAAGEVVGGIHGGNRIGGNAVADIVIFGRMAGENAAGYALRQQQD
ncbi:MULTISPECIES: flavocytochrome c [unclassified Tatumella]|uniref:flavocytochrome c n=1 Tax=unclassified Tatumella TaxID=2649542 RepID=UPI001BAFEEE7|nr:MULTISPECIES: flavocytochrome c [unclassified Tatumella]MBS0856741.1 flavocytochrome c [Tatumella sp. JGM16]MBS0877749.1 flavocytochrome c [Tatumella sp. JGM82]MBS0891462.1 flavocytochrome c [Tatumella sp. JGM94]MBS0902384.1 flavocytochrome c [Tatumella sp. JGM100]MBS0913303.1 flavocytochrome c [Tatumella sp. JGM91]